MNVAEDKFYWAEVVQRADFAPDLWMIRIRCRGEFKFIPGQYATLGVAVEGKRIERPYSIVSAPWEQEIEFFFELVPEGALTPHLYKLQRGDSLFMRKAAKGLFTVDRQNRRGPICELRAHSAQRLERRKIRRFTPSVPAQRRQPSVGVRLQRRTHSFRRGITLVHLRADGEPAMGSRRLAG